MRAMAAPNKIVLSHIVSWIIQNNPIIHVQQTYDTNGKIIGYVKFVPISI